MNTVMALHNTYEAHHLSTHNNIINIILVFSCQSYVSVHTRIHTHAHIVRVHVHATKLHQGYMITSTCTASMDTGIHGYWYPQMHYNIKFVMQDHDATCIHTHVGTEVLVPGAH